MREVRKLEDVLDHELELASGGEDDALFPQEARLYDAYAADQEKKTNDPKYAWRRRRDVQQA